MRWFADKTKTLNFIAFYNHKTRIDNFAIRVFEENDTVCRIYTLLGNIIFLRGSISITGPYL